VSGSAILIAPAELLPALSAGVVGTPGLQTFSDTDALRALETITRTRPSLVMLERRFSSTPRGAALVARIKADPSLTDIEVRVVPPDGEAVSAVAVATPRQGAPGQPGASPAPLLVPELDFRGTRRVPRHRLNDGVEVLVDGTRVSLVDLSTCGAQILSNSVLKPNQRVRISFADPHGTLRCGATVIWAAFEIPKGSPARYRAGLEFVDPEATSLDALARRHRREQ
jgi:hypothetical protein